MNPNDKILKIIVLLLVLSSSFYVILDARSEHKFPRHFDEFQDIGIANDIVDTGKLAFLDSNTGYERADHDSFNRNFEIGFHVFLAELKLSGFDLIFDYKYFPAIFSIITLLSIMAFFYVITRSFWAGIPAMLLYPTLQTNVVLLGPELFVPITLAFTFIFLFFASFIRFYKQDNKVHFYLSILFAIILFLIHPISLTFAIPIILLYIAFSPKLYEEHKKEINTYIILGITAIILSLFIFRKESFLSTIQFIISSLIFVKGWMIPDARFSLLELTTIPVLLLAIIGFYFSIAKRKNLVSSWALSTIIFYFLYNQYDWTLFAPYHRAVHYLILSAFVLVSLGIYYSGDYLIKNSKIKILSQLAITLIVIFIFVNAQNHIGKENYELRGVLDEDSYNAFVWIDNTYGTGNKVLSFPSEIWAFRAVSKNELFLPGYEHSFAAGTIDLEECYTKEELDFVVARRDFNCVNYRNLGTFGETSVLIVE